MAGEMGIILVRFNGDQERFIEDRIHQLLSIAP